MVCFRILDRSVGRRWWATAILLAWSVALPVQGEETSLPRVDQRWIEVETANFTFFSNAGSGTTKRIAADLEELRAVLAQLTDFELQSPVPTLIYVFSNDRSFTPYKLLYDGRPGLMSGYFTSRDTANYIAIDAGSKDASSIVFHEYVHYVSANNFWWLPLWLSEGLAEFYQTFTVFGDTAFIGLPIPGHLATLRGSTRVPLTELITVDDDSPFYNEAERKSDFYAQSWAVTHYLLLGDPERRQQLGRYVATIGAGTPPDVAFIEAFGPDLERLDLEVRGHLRSPRFPYLQSETKVDVDASMSIREMPYADVLYRLGDLLSIQDPVRPEVGAYFAAALEADPDHSQTLTAVALDAEERADWDAAADAYARAVRANPDDASAQFHWGEFLYRRRGDPQQAVAALTRAAELQPSFTPAWVTLSKVYAHLGNASPAALAAAETAHRLEPADKGTTYGLLRLYIDLDLRERAKKLIETSLQSDRQTAGEAWTVLLHNDLLHARELIQEDQSATASTILEAAAENLDRTRHPELVEREINNVRDLLREHEGAKIYDQAVEILENGDSQTARALLEQALANLPSSGPVTASCLHLIDVIDNPEAYAAPPPPLVSPTHEEIEHFNQKLAARDFEGALAFLREIRGRSTGEQTRWIDGKITELQRTINYNLYVDGYNQAVDFFNRQEYAEAIEVLDELLQALPPGPQADSAGALRDDAHSAIQKTSKSRR